MIEAPPENYFPIIIGLLGIVAIVSAFAFLDTGRKVLWYIGIGFSIFAIGFTIQLSDTTYADYKTAVFLEIELLECNQMQEHYDFYDESEFQEKIKSKYLFECVSEKTDLNWLK